MSEPLHHWDWISYALEHPTGEIAQRVKNLLAYANLGWEIELRWIQRIERYGVSNRLVADLNEVLRDFRGNAWLAIDPASHCLQWKAAAPEGLEPDREMLIPFEIAQLLTEGGFDGLKRCAVKDCRNYFVGNARAKWCSESCGSKHRVRMKRKRDKERGMML